MKEDKTYELKNITIHNVDDNADLTLRRVKPNPFTGETMEENSIGTRYEDSYGNQQQHYFTASFHNMCVGSDCCRVKHTNTTPC